MGERRWAAAGEMGVATTERIIGNRRILWLILAGT